ncbi:MAG: hypothetical protein CYG60_11840 [Actinobacteria bacterium]|nr:MAG: hypothetical protein CYG60_11840 [Actinomycetota bacterium]
MVRTLEVHRENPNRGCGRGSRRARRKPGPPVAGRVEPPRAAARRATRVARARAWPCSRGRSGRRPRTRRCCTRAPPACRRA